MLKWFKIGSPRGEYTMNRDFVGKWLDDLKKFWLNKDIETQFHYLKIQLFNKKLRLWILILHWKTHT